MKTLLTLFLAAILALPAQAAELDPHTAETDQTPSVTEPAATVHTHVWNTVTTPSTCTTAGAVTGTCVCGETTAETLPLASHTYGSWTAGSDGHSRSCSACGTVESAAHSWTPGAVTAQPSCTAAGSQTYTCACGATKTETLPITTHSFGEWDGNESSHSRTCTTCGAAESGGHSWADRTVTVASTCTEEGVEALFCTVCGGCLYEVLPLADHTYDNVCDPDCNVCGAVRDAAHKYSTAWSKNSREHWHACIRCNEKTDIGSHYPGPAATEEKAQLCLTCGLTMTPRLNHTHKYESTLTSDETGHWYACSGCEDQKDLQEHSYDNPCDPDCNLCGYRTNTAHSYGSDWKSDKTGHWSTCTLCGETSPAEPHTPDPKAQEGATQLCTLCKFEIVPAGEHIHKFEGDWLSDEENHRKACSCGETDAPAPHTWDEGRKEDDSILYTCTQCAAEKTEAAPAQNSFPWGLVFGILVTLALATAGILVFVLVRRPGSR